MQRRDNTCNNGVVFSRALTSEKSAARSLSAELLECARFSAAKVCHVSFTVPFQIETSTDIDGQGTVAGCRDMPQHPRAQCCDLHFDPDARSALLCNVLRLPGAWQEVRLLEQARMHRTRLPPTVNPREGPWRRASWHYVHWCCTSWHRVPCQFI